MKGRGVHLKRAAKDTTVAKTFKVKAAGHLFTKCSQGNYRTSLN